MPVLGILGKECGINPQNVWILTLRLYQTIIITTYRYCLADKIPVPLHSK